MRLEMDNAPEGLRPRPPEVGDVYATTKGTFNLLVAIRGNTGYALVFDREGELAGCTQYGVSNYFASRIPVGRVENLPELFPVTWL